jgi:uncharacterized protein with HEPN domain
LRSDRERLLDILDAIERIKRQTAQGRARFDQDEVVLPKLEVKVRELLDQEP